MNRSRVTGDLASQGNIFADIANDRVGIGSTIPTQKLDVVGTVKATAFSGDGSGLSGVTSVGGDTGADFNDSVKVRFGTGNDLELYHDGSHSYIHDGGTGNLKVRSNNFRVSNADESKLSATFQPAGAVELYHNNSKKLETTATSVTLSDNLVMGNHSIELNDNSQIMIGNAPDLRIYHDGNSSFISNTTGDLTLIDESRIANRTNQFVVNNHANNESIIYAAADGEVSLYHNGNKKFDTTGNGIDVTGTVTADNQIVLNSDDSSPARIDLYCEVSNAHYTRLQAPAHSTYSGNVTVTIPNASGNLAVLANAADNRIVTATGTHAMTGESNLTFDGNNLAMSGTGVFTITRNSRTLTLEGNYGNEGHPAIKTSSNHDLRIFTSGNNERLRITSGGRFLLGTTASRTIAGHSPRFTLNGDDYNAATLQITSNQNSSSGTFLQFSHQRSGSAGGNTILQSGDDFGRIRFTGGDGTNIDSRGAEIIAQVDGTPGVDDMPGRLMFMTTADGAQSTTERVRINSSGQVGINTTTGGRVAIAVDSSNTNPLATGFIALTLKNTNITDNTSVCMDFNNSVGGIVGRFGAQFTDTSDKDTDLYFATRQDGGVLSERLRIKSDGGMRLQKSDGNGNFTISRNASVTTTDQPIGVIDFASNTAHTVQARVMGKTRGTSNVGGDLVVEARANGGSLDERVRITGGGLLLIGRSSSRMVGGSTTYAKLQVAGTSQSDSSISIVNNENNANGAFLFIGKTRGGSVNTSTIVQSGDTLGGLSFIGADSTDLNNRTAEITAVVNGSPSGNTIPTDLTFSTSTQNATQMAERMRIYSSGRILIGDGGSEHSPSGNLDIVGDTNSNGPELYLRVSNNNTTDNIGALLFGNNVDKSILKIQGVTHTANNTGDITFHTSTAGTMTEKLRITSAGAIGLNGTNYGTSGQVLTSQGSGQAVEWRTIVQAPEISSISGNIFANLSTSLTLTGLHFGSAQGVLNFTQSSDSVDVDVNVTPTSDTSLTVTVPSSVANNVTAGNAVTISFTNSTGLVGSGSNTTVLALPSGGSITTSGNFRIHTFTSSGNFVLTKSVTVEYLVVAGGGGGGGNDGGQDFSGGSGGGGAGGHRTGSATPSASTHTITVGGGGSGNLNQFSGSDGNNSAFGSIVSNGGGGGGGCNNGGSNGRSGGSGGGAGGDDGSTVFNGGSGTSGQGNAGGSTGGSIHAGGGGGGGAGGVGGGGSGHNGGAGGTGSASSINGSSVTRAGGGGGGVGAGDVNGAGGSGGGGAGAARNTSAAVAGSANTGGGGGGAADSNVSSEQDGANGGSGIVILRYNVTNL